MRVLIDDGFSISRHTGIGRYTQYLLSALAQHAPEVLVSQIHLPVLESIRPAPFRRIAYLLWLATGYSHQLGERPPQIVHFTNFLTAFRKPKGVGYATTIHDLSVFRYGETKSHAYGSYLRQAIRQAIHTADVVFAPSDSIKTEIAEYLNVPLTKIYLSYIGTDLTPLARAESQTYLDRLVTDLENRPYLLFVGTLERRKNLVPLVHAFGLLRRQFPELRLLLAGRPGIGFEAIQEAITEVDPRHEAVHALSHCSDPDLRALYSACTAFVFPSLYEGYGIPVLEAMACGTPVVASDIPTNRELLADAGIITEATPEALSHAIQRLLASPSLRSQLIQRGSQRAQQFTAAQTTRQLLAGYQAARQ